MLAFCSRNAAVFANGQTQTHHLMTAFDDGIAAGSGIVDGHEPVCDRADRVRSSNSSDGEDPRKELAARLG